MPDVEAVSLKEFYAAAGRDLAYEARNRRWLELKLVELRRHGFVTPIYTYSGNAPGQGGRRLTGVKLTEAGKRAAANDGCWRSGPKVGPIETIEDLTTAVLELRKAHPAFDIELTLTEADKGAAAGGDDWRSGPKVGPIETIEDLTTAVLELRKAHPTFDIELTLELKKEKRPRPS